MGGGAKAASKAGDCFSKDAASGTKNCQPTTMSDEGVKFIADHEKFMPNLYNDGAGHCTIGYGHLVHLGPCNGSVGGFLKGISHAKGMELLKADGAKAAGAVNRYISVPLNQHQFDSLTSFTFNTGSGALRDSTLRRLLNQGDYSSVPGQMNRWVRGGGRVMGGLVKRRAAEGAMFSSGSYKPGY